MKKRINGVLEKYLKYDNVIVVCHEMVIKTIEYQEKVANGEIIEHTR